MQDNLQRLLLIVCGALVMAVLIAAGEPIDIVNEEEYARASGQANTVVTSIGTSSECLTASPGSSTCALFALRSLTSIKPTTNVTACCFLQTQNGAIGAAPTGETATEVTPARDSANDGCAGYRHEGGEPHDYMIASYATFKARGAGYTGLFCSGTVRGFHGDMVHPPCEDTAECTGWGAGTCNRADPTDGALIIECRAAASGTLVTAEAVR